MRWVLRIGCVLIVLGVLTACSNSSTDDLYRGDYEFRLLVLFDHTKLMIDYSTTEQLERVGLDPLHFENVTQFRLSDTEMISILEKSYGVDVSHLPFPRQIETLEAHMNEMMDNWSFE